MSTIPVKAQKTRSFHPLKPFYQLPGIVRIVLKRQRHYVVLTLLALVDIVLAVGLVTNASFFSQAVDRVVLLEELNNFSSTTGRPPFSTSMYVFPSRRQPLSLENAEKLSQNIAQTISGEVGLPVQHVGIEVSSGSLMLSPAPNSSLFSQGKNYLANVEMVYFSNVANQMQIVEGIPLDENGASKGDLDVWMYDSQAQAMGVHIGEKLLVSINLNTAKIPVTVSGIWKAKDPKGEFWFNNPDSSLKDTFLVRRSDYIKTIQPIIESGSGSASWYVILDQNKIVPQKSQQYLDGFKRSLDLINKYLPGSRMNMPPLDPLQKFITRSSALTVLLIGYNLPAFAILLYFLALTSAIMAQWQRRETVMLVARGMTISGVLNLTIIEQLLLFIIGYPIGILFGMLIARVMGYTSSFLAFTTRAPLPVSLQGLSLPLTFLALAFALFSRIWPALRAARSSLVMEERERARPMNKPFWYRLYLDVILLIPTYYAYDQMTKRGSLAGLINTKPEDLYRDPLLIVVPALFILTTSLVTMRLFALLMRLIDLGAGRIPWLTLHLALRQLGRQSLDYIQPLLLVIVSLAMGVYTLSMAASLDQWAVDRMYYQAGADYAFTPQPLSGSDTIPDGSWIPLPGDFTTIPGIQAATRVADLTLVINPDSEKQTRGSMLAIDRAEFPSAAWFRPDFARESLGALMNQLAVNEGAVLVPEKYLQDNNLRIGDTITATVNIQNLVTIQTEFLIAGTYIYFPTVYEEDGVTFIGNLDYLSTLTGLTIPHDIWLRLAPNVDTKVLEDTLSSTLSVKVARPRDARALVNVEVSRFERVGIFGTLSVGFLATALMAILGLLIYSYASLQERAYRLAVLNAVGLSRNQILAQVVMEYAFLALFGAIAGALIGLYASDLFVPFFRYTGGKGIPLPPLLPIIAGNQLRNLSALFGFSIVAVEVLTITSLLRKQLSQILKRVWM